MLLSNHSLFFWLKLFQHRNTQNSELSPITISNNLPPKRSKIRSYETSNWALLLQFGERSKIINWQLLTLMYSFTKHDIKSTILVHKNGKKNLIASDIAKCGERKTYRASELLPLEIWNSISKKSAKILKAKFGKKAEGIYRCAEVGEKERTKSLILGFSNYLWCSRMYVAA